MKRYEETEFNPEGQPISYKSELGIPPEELALIDSQTDLIRLVKFKIKPDAFDQIKELKGKREPNADGVFVYLDAQFTEMFFIDVFNAIRKSPDLVDLFERVNQLIQISRSPAGPTLDRILSEGYETGNGSDLLKKMFSLFMEAEVNKMFKHEFKPGGRDPFKNKN